MDVPASNLASVKPKAFLLLKKLAGFARATEFDTVAVMGKHVIFLGAGASKASCYPLANELRLILSSEHHFVEWVRKCFPGYGTAASLAQDYFNTFKSSIMLFRKGCFASVDEFCKLATGQPKSDAVQHMRFLTRAALGALNPEDEFEYLEKYPFVQSDYYPFVQRLFRADLKSLRPDISILSFNYDPYLEFLLRRAWEQRNGGLPNSDIGNSITSGFHDPYDGAWNKSDQARLYLLKLHGSISDFVVGRGISTDFLFEGSKEERAKCLFDPQNVGILNPIIFPWEILDQDLKFNEKQFPIQNDPSYFKLFVSIWERARKEVQAADKVSFVGLSMHEYLKLGFRYLFEGKEGQVQVVVANLVNKELREEDLAGGRPNPNSPCWRAGDVIREVTKGKVLCRYSERDRKHISWAPENTQPCVIPRDSFSDFIEHEL